jgi:hypothetical protein
MTMAPVVAEDQVAVLQGFRNSHADPFLADARVNRAKQLALCEEFEQSFLDTANEHRFGNKFEVKPAHLRPDVGSIHGFNKDWIGGHENS